MLNNPKNFKEKKFLREFLKNRLPRNLLTEMVHLVQETGKKEYKQP